METIFETRIEGYLKSNPKNLIKLNLELKKLGFNKVLSSQEVTNELYFNELTLIEKPSNYQYNIIPKKVREEVCELVGFREDHLFSVDIPENAIKLRYKGVDFGFYYKERNYLCMFYPFLSGVEYSIEKKNEITPFILGLIKEIHEKDVFENVDTSDIGRKILAEEFNSVWREKVKQNERTIKTTSEYLVEYTEKMTNSYKQINLMQKENEAIKTNLNKGVDKVEEVIKKLENSKFLKEVKIEKGVLTVDYGKINVKYEGEEIYLGDYHAELRSNGVRIINKDPIMRGEDKLHHPHILDTEGRNICFGGSRAVEITKMLSNLDYDKLAYMLLLFLKNYNEDDCYHKIYHWTEINTDDEGVRRYNG